MVETPPNPADRTMRYRDAIPINLFQSTPVVVVGLGAIGRPLALTLAQMGVQTLHLFDGDTVEHLNLGPQGFRPDNVGEIKSCAVRREAIAINPDPNNRHNAYEHWTVDDGILDRATGTFAPNTPIFSCVDSMEVRKQLFDAYPTQPFFDCRMGAKSLHVWSATDLRSRDAYAKGWFPDSESEPVPCTARSTAYCAQIAAGFALSNYVQMLSGDRPPAHLTLNIPDLTLKVTD